MKIRLAVRTSSGTSGAAAWEVRTAATPGRWNLVELHVLIGAATVGLFGLGRPAAIGVTPTAPVDLQLEDPNDVLAAAAAQVAVAWATGPTIPATFLHRLPVAAAIGNGGIFTFPQGIVIPVSGALILWNLATNPVADVTAVLEI